VFHKAVVPFLTPDSKVLELGPGRGSWSRAILKYIPSGELHVVDFQNVKKWLKPEKYDGRLICHKVEDNSFAGFKDEYFDFFWSFGVLCHNNIEQIRKILASALKIMKSNGVAVHHYGDWDKLDKYGWGGKSNIPVEFKNMPDEEIWWPHNDQQSMRTVAKEAGWIVESTDLGLVKRDSIIYIRKPG
jgi:SAM-dependent methyltransferase